MKPVLSYLLLLILLFSERAAYSQKEGDNWMVGSTPVFRVNFGASTEADSACPTFQVTKAWGGACISDSAGNYLFFSNGVRMFNAQCDTIVNSSGICPPLYSSFVASGSRTFQDNIILPKKGSTYYLINYSLTDNAYNTDGIWDLMTYHIIDIAAAGGQGEVTSKNNIMLNVKMNGSQFTACRHANGRDWWVIKAALSVNTYYKFLFTPDTVMGPITQVVSPDTITYVITPGGQAGFSPDGSLYASTSPLGKLVVHHFDRCTGEFTPYKNFWALSDTVQPYLYGGRGLSFSPNGKFIYLNDNGRIFQYDLNETDSAQAVMLVGHATPDTSFALFTNMHLGPDNRIYIDNYNFTIDAFSYIANPDVKGTNCGFCQACFPLPIGNGAGITNTINFRLGREIGSACDTIYNDTPKPIAINSNSLKLIPNPANNIVSIEYGDIGYYAASLQITDAIGQVVHRQTIAGGTANCTISTTGLHAGIYVVNISSKQHQLTAKLVVQR